MEDILWIEDAVDTPITPFFNTSNLDMVGFVVSHKVVVWRNTFSTFTSAQNECVS
jgi:hypothetical protein